MINKVIISVLLLLSSCSNENLGWFILSPNNIEGLTNLKFLLSGLTTTIYISTVSILISMIMLLIPSQTISKIKPNLSLKLT